MLGGFKQFAETDERKNLIKGMIESGQLVFFFEKDGRTYGCPEESRIAFARLKHPDEDEDKDGDFIAIEVNKDKDPKKVVFGKNDLKGIKVVDRDDVISKLDEVAPPGWSGTVVAMRVHHPEIKNPYALSWWMHKKHDHPHYKETPNKKTTGHKVPKKKGNK